MARDPACLQHGRPAALAVCVAAMLTWAAALPAREVGAGPLRVVSVMRMARLLSVQGQDAGLPRAQPWAASAAHAGSVQFAAPRTAAGSRRALPRAGAAAAVLAPR
ncbi:MAG: hypothetical protein RLW62_22360 [Gammaproteobacteria bacterium]